MTDKSIKLDIAIGIFIVLLFMGISYKGLPFFISIDKSFYDIAVRFSPDKHPGSSNIVLIDIDDHSIAELGPWPWPRNQIANMINILKENGIKLIGLNILYPNKENKEALQAMEALSGSLDNNLKIRMQEAT